MCRNGVRPWSRAGADGWRRGGEHRADDVDEVVDPQRLETDLRAELFNLGRDIVFDEIVAGDDRHRTGAVGLETAEPPEEEFTGANKLRGVNPATGVVVYYQLPELKKTDEISMEIKDAAGNIVRSFSSKADEKYIKYEDAPKPEPLLPKAKGLNRFVWDMRYATMPGVPGADMEISYAGHKAPPGKYSLTVKMGEQTVSTEAEILANPLYPINASTYMEYHRTMLDMENELTSMHRMVNSLYEKQKQLESLLSSLPAGDKFSAVKKEGDALLKKMKAWDEDMVQRKSKAYDDVENFPNKFTANYLFLINQTESDIPRVNQPSLDRLKQLNTDWSVLKARGSEILDKDVPSFNKRLWELGLGAIWKD